LSYPLLEGSSIFNATCVLFIITSTSEITLDEMTQASDCIHEEIGEDSALLWGQVIDETLGDEIRVSVILEF